MSALVWRGRRARTRDFRRDRPEVAGLGRSRSTSRVDNSLKRSGLRSDSRGAHVFVGGTRSAGAASGLREIYGAEERERDVGSELRSSQRNKAPLGTST